MIIDPLPVRRRTVQLRLGAGLALLPVVALVAGCGSSGPKASPTTTAALTTTTTVPTTTTTTTVPLTVASGPETVLSPIGLNVRAKPSHSAKVLGTAAQGTVLQLLGHTSHAGGWYKAQGATVTGWISANPALSAHGDFASYSSGAFSVLYPAGWTATGAPATGVTFRAPATTEKVVITAAPSTAKLPSVSQGAGVAQSSSRQVVACGVSAYLHTYTTATASRYLAQVTLVITAHHALGFKGTLTSPTELRTFMDFVNSASFPYPVCVGGPPPTTSAKTKPAAQKKAGTTSTSG